MSSNYVHWNSNVNNIHCYVYVCLSSACHIEWFSSMWFFVCCCRCRCCCHLTTVCVCVWMGAINTCCHFLYRSIDWWRMFLHVRNCSIAIWIVCAYTTDHYTLCLANYSKTNGLMCSLNQFQFEEHLVRLHSTSENNTAFDEFWVFQRQLHW